MAISDVSFLTTLTNLERLGFAHNNVQDISALVSLTSLKSCFVYSNQISDISPLTGLTTLESAGLLQSCTAHPDEQYQSY